MRIWPGPRAFGFHAKIDGFADFEVLLKMFIMIHGNRIRERDLAQ